MNATNCARADANCAVEIGWRWAVIALSLTLTIHLSAQNCRDANEFFLGRQVGEVRANRMDHLSGMAASRANQGVLWVHNGGEEDRFFALAADGRPAGTFTLPADLMGLEALVIAAGASPVEDVLYLGDIGDPQGQRRTVTVVRVPEPAVTPDDSKTRAAAGAVSFELSYPDSGHDAQALLWDPRAEELYLVTHEATRGLLFRVRKDQLIEGKNAILEQVAHVPFGGITGGDISFNGQRIALRNEKTVWVWKRQPAESVPAALSKTPSTVELVGEDKGKALAWDPEGTGFFTVAEGQDEPIYFHAENRTRFTVGLPLATVTDSALDEVSGIASSRRNPGVVWMVNDGPDQVVFAISSTGALVARASFNLSVIDLEDIAVGPGESTGNSFIYIADIGDNDQTRDHVTIIRAPEPDLLAVGPDAALTFSSAERITLRYPDGPHDAEALLVDPRTGDIYIATKEDDHFRLYAAAQSELVLGQELTLTLVHTGDFGLVSGGDISPDGSLIALRREDAARMWKRAPGQSIPEALRSSGEQIPVVGPPREPNGESLTFQSNVGEYVTFSEGKGQSLYVFRPLAIPGFAGLPSATASGWQLALTGCAGEHVRVESSSDLVNWTTLGEVVLTGDPTPFASNGSEERRFFRLVLP